MNCFSCHHKLIFYFSNVILKSKVLLQHGERLYNINQVFPRNLVRSNVTRDKKFDKF